MTNEPREAPPILCGRRWCNVCAIQGIAHKIDRPTPVAVKPTPTTEQPTAAATLFDGV